MSDSYVCSNAKIKCSCGDKISTLTVLPNRTIWLTGQPQANISDHTPMLNIAPFGKCRTVAYPPTAAATAAAHGKLTPMPCVPNTPFPWMNGKSDYLLKGQPALLKSSTLKCAYGGTITITFDGQKDTGNQLISQLSKENLEPEPQDIQLKISLHFFLGTKPNIPNNGLVLDNAKFNFRQVYNVYLGIENDNTIDKTTRAKHEEQIGRLKNDIIRYSQSYIEDTRYQKVIIYIYGYHCYEKDAKKEYIRKLFDDNIKNNRIFPGHPKVDTKIIFRGNKHQRIGETREPNYNKLIQAYKINSPNENEADTWSKIKCVNLDKPVEIMTTTEFSQKYGEIELFQYAHLSNKSNTMGCFFTVRRTDGSIPTQEDLGLAPEPKRPLKKYKFNMKKFVEDNPTLDCRIIESTAFKAVDTWSHQKNDIINSITTTTGVFSKGGGQQIEIPKLFHDYFIEILD